jgi:predicted nucleic acid-binding protein
MIYALDTNIISFLLRRERNQEVVRRFEDEIVQLGSDADIFIAAHCIINGYTLVTDNTSDFQRIGCGIKIVNWKK